MGEDSSVWIRENNKPNWLHRQIIAILRTGAIPKHIAIIMDGNRRYAKQSNIARDMGHLKGFEKLTEVLQWCLDLGITEVTVYAFSIENFKRSPEEVNGLMDLFREKMRKLIEERNKLEEHGVCVRILGNISLLPLDLQKLVAQAVTMSSSYNRAFLNVCIAYTARDDMCNAVATVAEGIHRGCILESDVTEDLLDSCMLTGGCPPLDVLLRTSGEVRLSDFMLWQSSYSLLSFTSVLWPEFSRWDLYAAVLYYQRHCGKIQSIQKSHKERADLLLSCHCSDGIASVTRQRNFIESVRESRSQELAALCAF